MTLTATEKKSYLLKLISNQGDRHGNNGGIADLLDKYNKNNTMEVTIEECEEFLRLNKEG